MGSKQFADGIAAGRLGKKDISDNFTDMHPALNAHEALVAADRCYFCYDAPCMTACPTSIDIPMFIRQISTGNVEGSAKTILDQNILGGMCARVCPTETLCEQACVRQVAEGKPVQIGLLQRFATDEAMAENKQFYTRAKSSGKKIAIVGAGPAGLACAHRLSAHGHDAVIFDAHKKSGGLNEYGIAAYKSTDEFAQREVDYITAIGGIEIKHGKKLGRDFTIDELSKNYDAVFLGMGLSGVNDLGNLGLKEKDPKGVENAVDFIEKLRQAKDKSKIAIGRRVVVIGGGMTAIDCAVQAKLLGAEQVTICYRRGQEHMNASPYEQDHATANGVVIRHWLMPSKINVKDGKVLGISLEYSEMKNGKLVGTGQKVKMEVDQIFAAIGQSLRSKDLDLALNKGRIKIDEEGHTSIKGIWAGGDCTDQGDDLTVTAVAQGRDAAMSIHKSLMG